MTAFTSLSLAMFKASIRDKAALALTFFFPLMFLVVFAVLFGGGMGSSVKIAVVGDGQVVSALSKAEGVDLVRFDNSAAAIDQLRDGDLAAVVLSQGDGVDVRYANGDRPETAPALAKVSEAVASANAGVGGAPPKYSMQQAPIEAAYAPIQYLTPGILSWGVASAAVFSSALTLVAWRRKQVLRRLQLAPVGRVSVLTARLAIATGISLMQAVLFVAVASLPVFGLQLSNDWWLAIPLLVLGTFAFFSVGMLTGAVCQTEDSVSGAANLVVLPMALLGGSFFPVDKAPEWVKFITNLLPLKHMNEGMLDVLVRGKGIDALLLPGAVLIGFTIVISVFAAMFFRWEDA
ncbi:ABC transporter permease [Lentzea sp. NPDC058450]|uniref:ABC transporter permease n=1 Tax=Lentzea sp. NPDC058450 TaxID=3346505 RepID=UPI003660C7D9